MPHLSCENIKSTLIVGAGHGIGLALVREALERFPNSKILATFRNKEKAKELLSLASYNQRVIALAWDPTHADRYALLQQWLETQTSQIQVCINTVGSLHDGIHQPEKSLKDIDQQWLIEMFRVNATVSPLLAQTLFPYFKTKTPSLFVTLSAKVGSIEDNRLGGWYGYRASKAALNMFIKCIAIELPRRGCRTLVIALHPGTTTTELSKPFVENSAHSAKSPSATASCLFSVLCGLEWQDQGSFLSWDGSVIPW